MAPPRPRLIAPLLSTAFALALILDQLRLGWLAGHAEVSHLLAAPPVWLWAVFALLALAALYAAMVLAQRRADVRLSRLPLLLLVVVAFVEFFVTPAVRTPGGPDEPSLLVHMFDALAESSAVELGRLPSSTAELAPVVAQLGVPPYLVHGARVPRWKLELKRNCDGPESRVGDLGAGTYVYCLSADGGQAWVTVVGRQSSTFGPPEILSERGKPVFGAVKLPREPAAARPE